MMGITFVVIGPRGLLAREEGLDHVVLRRREKDRAPGSEVAVYRRHAPTLILTESCEARLVASSGTRSMRVPAGVAEVLDDRVTLVVAEGALRGEDEQRSAQVEPDQLQSDLS